MSEVGPDAAAPRTPARRSREDGSGGPRILLMILPYEHCGFSDHGNFNISYYLYNRIISKTYFLCSLSFFLSSFRVLFSSTLVMDIFGLGSVRSQTAPRPGRTSGSTRRRETRASPPAQSGRAQGQGQESIQKLSQA